MSIVIIVEIIREYKFENITNEKLFINLFNFMFIMNHLVSQAVVANKLPNHLNFPNKKQKYFFANKNDATQHINITKNNAKKFTKIFAP